MRPAVAAIADDLYEELGVTQPADEQLGWPFLIFLAGVGTALGRLPAIVRDTDDGPGWSAVLDVARSEAWALPYLAQFVGVRLLASDDDATQRAKIVAHSQFNRGTPGAMRAVGQLQLTGTKHLTIVEQADGSPWRLRAFTLTAETPDPAAELKALLTQKPGGMKLIHEVVDGTAWDEAVSTWDAATPTWESASDGPI